MARTDRGSKLLATIYNSSDVPGRIGIWRTRVRLGTISSFIYPGLSSSQIFPYAPLIGLLCSMQNTFSQVPRKKYWVSLHLPSLSVESATDCSYQQTILVLCRRDSFAKSLDFREDGIGRSRPHERVCVGVPFGRVAFDALDELRHLAERIAPNRLAGKDIEPDLHLIEPRSIGGGVVNVKSGTPCQPSLDLGLLMRGVVVDDEMNIEVSGDVGLDGAQELKELLVTMTGLALGHHFPGGYVQGGKSGWWCHGACNRA